MVRGRLILDRYTPLGKAGSGGYGTVQVAWDPRIQRKVAIKTIELSDTDIMRANLPGAADDPRPLVDASQLAPLQNAPGFNQRKTPAHASNAGDSEQPTIALPDRDDFVEDIAALDDAFAAEAPLPWEDGVSPWDAHAAGAAATDGGAVDASAPSAADQGPVEGLHSLAKVPGLDEARTAAMLQDPRIVTVYDVEIKGRTAYLIMEYVEGITLTRLMRDYADYLSLDIVAAVFDAVAGALQAAHKKGVLHLDIKPDNVLINTKGQVKVTDFGLATLADASGHGTAGGGTVGYMPLEQMRREDLDVRTDEWSLAAVTYEMLTGENPFLAPTLDEAEAAIENAELVLPSLCWDDLDEQLDDVVFYALDPDREERYASVADFAEEVDKFLGNADQGAHDLEIIVADALDVVPESMADAEAEAEAAAAAAAAAGGDVAGEGRGARFARRLSEYTYDEEPTYTYGRDRGDRGDRDDSANRANGAVPVRDRLSARMLDVAGRAFAAIACALIALLAVKGCGVVSLATQTGMIAAAVAAVVAGACALVRPHVGALVAFCLFGASLILGNLPITGAGVIVVAIVWWYLVARRGSAQTNCALALPFVGGVGAFSFVPLCAGALLRPRDAVGTAVFAALIGVALSTLCSGDLTGWRALFYWETGAVYGSFDRLVDAATAAQTWCIVVSWILGALAESALCQTRKPALSVLGIVLGAIIMTAGVVGYAWFASNLQSPAPSIGFVLPIVVSALIMIVIAVWLRPTQELCLPARERHKPKKSKRAN